MLVAQTATQEQIKRYQYDLWLTLYRQEFRYYTFDVKEAWQTAIREWFEGRHSPLVDILGPVKSALEWFWDNILKPPLEALFDAVKSAILKAIGGISSIVSGISDVLGSVWETIQGLGSWIWSQVSSGLSWLKDTLGGAISSAASWIWSQVSSGLSAVGGAIRSGLSWVWDQVSAGLKWVYEGIAAVMSRVAEYVVSGLQGIFAGLKAIGEWIWEGIKTVIVDPIVSLVKGAIETIKSWGENIATMIRGGIEPKSPVAIEGSLKRVLGVITGVGSAIAVSEIGIHVANAMHPMKNLELRQTRDLWLHVAGFHALLSSFQAVYFRAAVEIPLAYELNKMWTPKLPDAAQILQMLSRYKITPERAHELMRYHGFGPEFDSWWDELANTPLSFTMLRWAAMGGTLDEQWVEEELKRAGYSRKAVEQLKRAVRFLADSYDIRDCASQIRALVKEGFMTKDQARGAFEAFRALTTPLERQLFIADLAYLYDFKTDQRDAILTRLRKGKISIDAARAELGSIVVVDEKREWLIEKVLAAMKLSA